MFLRPVRSGLRQRQLHLLAVHLRPGLFLRFLTGDHQIRGASRYRTRRVYSE